MPSGRSDWLIGQATRRLRGASSLRPGQDRAFPTHRLLLRHQDRLRRRSEPDLSRCSRSDDLETSARSFLDRSGVMQSMDSSPLRSAATSNPAPREERKSLRSLRECCSKVVQSLSLFSATGDRSTLVSRTKISSLDPSLASVRPAHPAEPLPPFSDPPIKRSRR